MIKPQVDILIVGGGLVGHSLAYALRDLPLSVALIEANSAPPSLNNTFDTRAISLSFGSTQIFERLGLWTKMQPHAEAIRTVHVSEKGQFGFTRLNAEEFNVPAFGYVTEISDLHRILLTANQETQLDFLCPATLTGLESHADHISATIQHLGEEKTISAGLLIAADGANSIVRKLQRIPASRHDYHHTAIATTLGLSRDHQHIAYERFTSNGPLALLPLQNRRYATIWTMPTDKANTLLTLSDSDFTKELQHWIGYRLGRLTRIGHRVAYPLEQIQACQPRLPHTLLIGNAAHTLHPVVGQGFNLGLGDVAALADILRRKKETLDMSEIIDAYQQRRKWRQNTMALFTHSLVECFCIPFSPLRWARNLGMIAVDRIYPLKQGLTQYLMDV